MIERSVQGKLLVLAVFVIGIATGVLSANLYRSRVVLPAKAAENHPEDHLSPQQHAKQGFDRMANYLGLDQTQRDQIQKIVDETGKQLRELRGKTEPQYKAIGDNSRDQVMAVLSEEQRRKYKEFRETHPEPGGPRGRGSRPPEKNQDKKR